MRETRQVLRTGRVPCLFLRAGKLCCRDKQLVNIGHAATKSQGRNSIYVCVTVQAMQAVFRNTELLMQLS